MKLALSRWFRPPLLTAIVPTYNRPRELALCLEGFAAQTAPAGQFEVIVVDDGSPQSMAEVCRGFANKIQIKFIRQQNSGPSVARNAAIRRAHSNLLLLYDDDLRPCADIVERCLAFHREFPAEGNVALLHFCADHSFASDPLNQWAFSRLYPFPLQATTGDWRLFWSGTTTAKRSLFRRASFSPDYRSLEDVEFALRISCGMDLRVHYTPRPAGTMTRQLRPQQVFSRFYSAGYFCWRLIRDYPGESGSLTMPYDAEPDVFRDPGELKALLASARALSGGQMTPGRFKMLAALWNRASVHAQAEGWLAARDGKPPRAPGTIEKFLDP